MERYHIFKEGDVVIWNPERVSDTRDLWIREQYGLGPFTISKAVIRDNRRDDYDEFGQSTWESMGHCQHVWLKEVADETDYFSGAWFLPVQSDK